MDVDEPRDVGLDARLLAHLAHGRGPRRLARLDVPAGQAPPALERALGPLDQQHGAVAKDGGAGAASRPGGVAADGLRISTHAGASLAAFALSGANQRPMASTLFLPGQRIERARDAMPTWHRRRT